MCCELRPQSMRPVQSPLGVGAETLNQKRRREGVGRAEGREGVWEAGGRYKTGSPEDSVPCSLC